MNSLNSKEALKIQSTSDVKILESLKTLYYKIDLFISIWTGKMIREMD
jgi:hypothetical protein